MSVGLPHGRSPGVSPLVPRGEAVLHLRACTTILGPRRLVAASQVPAQRGQEADDLVLAQTESLADQEPPRVLVLVTAKDPTPRRPRRSVAEDILLLFISLLGVHNLLGCWDETPFFCTFRE